MAKIIKLNESDLNKLVARVIKEQAATAASIAAKKPVMASDRVKQLVGFLQNGKYTSSERLFRMCFIILSFDYAPYPVLLYDADPAFATGCACC